MYSLADIETNYKEFPDEKIISLAKKESKGLRKDVIPILKEEIIKRGLDRSLLNWIDAETTDISDDERQKLFKKITNLPCSFCQDDRDLLRGFQINKVISFLIGHERTTETRILCCKCGNKLIYKSMAITFLTGWWSKGGFFSTPFTLINDLINLFFLKRISNRVINGFIDNNIGRIRLRGQTDKALASLINNFNKRIEK